MKDTTRYFFATEAEMLAFIKGAELLEVFNVVKAEQHCNGKWIVVLERRSC